MDSRLQQFIQQETERQRFQKVIHELNEKCWDTCIEPQGKPSNRLDGKSESCLRNCVDRFIDANLLVTGRIQKKAMEMAGQGELE